MTPSLDIVALEAAVLVARALSIVAGVLVCLDSAKIISGIEQPIHNPRGNALAWATIAIGAVIGGAALIYLGRVSYGRMGTVGNVYVGALVWTSISTGLVWRASIRSHRPRMIWGSALIFGIAGLALTLGEALGGSDMAREWLG